MNIIRRILVVFVFFSWFAWMVAFSKHTQLPEISFNPWNVFALIKYIYWDAAPQLLTLFGYAVAAGCVSYVTNRLMKRDNDADNKEIKGY